MRLQRFLAQAGLSSRRGATSLLQTGRVAVNGKVALEPGIAVDPRQDRITVDGRPVAAQAAVYVVLHKPPGTICSTRDPEGRETVLDLVRVPGARLYPVGRLDYLTSGVLLLTNDGDLAQALLHPRHGVERTYHVKVHGLLDDEEVQQLAAGVVLDDGQRAQAKVARLASTCLLYTSTRWSRTCSATTRRGARAASPSTHWRMSTRLGRCSSRCSASWAEACSSAGANR